MGFFEIVDKTIRTEVGHSGDYFAIELGYFCGLSPLGQFPVTENDPVFCCLSRIVREKM
jgi:hypothetical protein